MCVTLDLTPSPTGCGGMSLGRWQKLDDVCALDDSVAPKLDFLISAMGVCL